MNNVQNQSLTIRGKQRINFVDLLKKVVSFSFSETMCFVSTIMCIFAIGYHIAMTADTLEAQRLVALDVTAALPWIATALIRLSFTKNI